jgi:SAM-dependent methyltransferase
MARRVEAMYNAHPFPDRQSVPSSKSDERYEFIYRNFLHIPLDELKDKVFLDAGCGTGDVTWAWRRILDPTTRVMGIDLSQTSIFIARQAHTRAALQPAFAVGSLLDLAIANQSVDFVLCSGVLVAVPDPDRAFKELARILKPGGYMVLVLYHKYGRALHGLRRAVIDLIEPKDIDRRARLGGRLFGRSMKKLARDEDTPLEGILYDQFGLPCESRYSVGQALRWFKEAGLSYLGTWPPIEWSQLGNGLRFSKQLAPVRRSLPFRSLLQIFPEDKTAPDRPPRLMTRISMQALWTLNQQQLFALSGRKE